MSQLSLQAAKRTKKQSIPEGNLPAVVYGRGMESTALSVDDIEFKKLFDEAGESTIFTLSVDGIDHDVLIHDYQRHPVTHAISHIDFYAIEKGQSITVSVPLEFIGEAPVKNNNEVQIVYVLHELEVECQPKDLPSAIEVDISLVAELGDVIHVSDIKLPAGVVPTLEPEEAVVSTSAVKEIVEEEEADPGEVDLSAIEVEGQSSEESEAASEE